MRSFSAGSASRRESAATASAANSRPASSGVTGTGLRVDLFEQPAGGRPRRVAHLFHDHQVELPRHPRKDRQDVRLRGLGPAEDLHVEGGDADPVPPGGDAPRPGQGAGGGGLPAPRTAERLAAGPEENDQDESRRQNEEAAENEPGPQSRIPLNSRGSYPARGRDRKGAVFTGRSFCLPLLTVVR